MNSGLLYKFIESYRYQNVNVNIIYFKMISIYYLNYILLVIHLTKQRLLFIIKVL